MRISINRNSDTPVYLQIKNQLRDMIISGQLPPGHILPTERSLCQLLEVNRTTVVKAYHELKADGLAEARVGRGTSVSARYAKCSPAGTTQFGKVPWYQYFNEGPELGENHIISDIMDINCNKDIVSFSGGLPDPELYPLDDLDTLHQKLLSTHKGQLLLHSPVEGIQPLRSAISSLMRSRSIEASPRDIMILSGSQQGLDYIARVFLKPGDTVIVEEPSFFGAIQIFRAAGAKVIGIPTDDQGMRTDILESLILRYKPKFIYTLPTFQNPSGMVMSLDRRYELLNLSYKYRTPIVEDDPYGDLRYTGRALPSLKALDSREHVIYLSTFSKVLSIGLRIGWIAAPQEIIRKFAWLKQMTDLHTNTPSQYLISEFLTGGHYQKHLDRIVEAYGKKLELMNSALEEYGQSLVSWNKPEGGYYIWCRLPEYMTNSRLVSKAAEKGVSYLPGEVCYPDGTQGESFMRLNFTFTTPDRIAPGIKGLMEALTDVSLGNRSNMKEMSYNRRPIV